MTDSARTAGRDVAEHQARILIVDDERHNRELLEIMLTPEGFLLGIASCGEEALASVAEQPPDLILLDIMMPGMDGYAVTTSLKSNPATKHIPVIMITALDDRDARMRGLNAGAEEFLSKPIDRAELTIRVRNLLRLKAYGDHFDQYSQVLEGEVDLGTSKLVDTERRSASALRHERSRAQRYLDTAAVILLALDVRGRITLVNQYACSILEWTGEELVGRDWVETCVPARFRDLLRNKFQDLLGGDLSVVENPVLTRSGEERLIEWRNTVEHDDAGNVIGTFSSGTDITARHQAVEALRTAEERMRFALTSADVGIWDMDYTTGILKWSETIEAHYGLLPGMFSGSLEAFIERVHPDDRESVLHTIGQAIASGSDFAIENRSVAPDGQVRWLTGAGRIVLGEHGEPVRGVGISQDVTERRKLDAQYQQAQKMDAIGNLASGVAHDFNNLLTVILGFAGFVAEDATIGPRHSGDLGEIIKAAHRAAGLTQQLLAFSRQQVLQTAALDLNGLITDMTGMLSRLIGEHIEIRLALSTQLSLALADRGQVEQVVMNLVVNARDAMPGGGTLTIETTDIELEQSSLHDQTVMHGRYVMLAISDTGSGMTKETQRRLFEPFFTTKEAGKGTGLGLSTTYGIVKQSKGYIWVYSELGRGTTFKVYLPRASDDVPSPVVSPVASAAVKRAWETVLLVEDEGGLRLLAKRILENAGYRVVIAENVEDAEKLFTHHPDPIGLVLTDVVMPGCGGPELVRRLRIHSPALKVLYMSGYTEQSAAHKLGLGNGVPFVQKPFTAVELVRQVRDVLG
jgi:PAS domain S-box-containing protein